MDRELFIRYLERQVARGIIAPRIASVLRELFNKTELNEALRILSLAILSYEFEFIKPIVENLDKIEKEIKAKIFYVKVSFPPTPKFFVKVELHLDRNLSQSTLIQTILKYYPSDIKKFMKISLSPS